VKVIPLRWVIFYGLKAIHYSKEIKIISQQEALPSFKGKEK
jgi:hypothetical protein